MISPPKLSEDQKKKEKVFTALWDYIRPEFVGFSSADWPFFVWSSSAQISMGGRVPLQFKQFKYSLYNYS